MLDNNNSRLVVVGGDVQVKFNTWESGNGAMPKQAQKCTDPFKVTINGTEQTVYHNRSKNGTAYFYTQNKAGVWCWTRDDVSAGAKFVNFVKPVKVKAEVKIAEKALVEKPEATSAVQKPAIKVIKKNKVNA
jgi:hypothetical protein